MRFLTMLVLVACGGAAAPETPGGTYDYAFAQPNGAAYACTNGTTIAGTLSLAPGAAAGWFTGSGDYCGSTGDGSALAYIADGDAALWFLGVRVHGQYSARCITGQVYGAGEEGATFKACKRTARAGKALGPERPEQ